jgi:hypothetical protein
MDFAKVTTLHMRDRVWLVDVPESGEDAAGHVVMLGLQASPARVSRRAFSR